MKNNEKNTAHALHSAPSVAPHTCPAPHPDSGVHIDEERGVKPSPISSAQPRHNLSPPPLNRTLSPSIFFFSFVLLSTSHPIERGIEGGKPFRADKAVRKGQPSRRPHRGG